MNGKALPPFLERMRDVIDWKVIYWMGGWSLCVVSYIGRDSKAKVKVVMCQEDKEEPGSWSTRQSLTISPRTWPALKKTVDEFLEANKRKKRKNRELAKRSRRSPPYLERLLPETLSIKDFLGRKDLGGER